MVAEADQMEIQTNTGAWSERDERTECTADAVCSLFDLETSFQLQTSLIISDPGVHAFTQSLQVLKTCELN